MTLPLVCGINAQNVWWWFTVCQCVIVVHRCTCLCGHRVILPGSKPFIAFSVSRSRGGEGELSHPRHQQTSRASFRVPRRAIRVGSDCTVHFRLVSLKRGGDSHRRICAHDTASRLRYEYPDCVGVVHGVTVVVHMMHHVTTWLCLQRLTPDDLSALPKPDQRL
jgi:hypothetical protein